MRKQQLIPIFLLLLSSQLLTAQPPEEVGVRVALGLSPIYVFFLLFFFHFPFVIFSFLFATNSRTMDNDKVRNGLIGLNILFGANSLLLLVPLIMGVYYYPVFVLWIVPAAFLWMGKKKVYKPILMNVLTVVYLLTFVLFLLGGNENYYGFGPRNGLVETYYPSGVLMTEEQFDFGYREGFYKEFHESGPLKYVANYTHDTLQGTIEEYYENGQLMVKYAYYNQAKNGPFVSYYENGNLKSKMHYVNNQIEGRELYYYQNKQIQRDCNYSNGIKNGLCQEFYESGALQKKAVFKNGIAAVFEAFYEDGRQKAIGSLRYDKPVDVWEYYHPNGQIAEMGRYLYDSLGPSVQHGLWKSFHQNGQLRSKGEYEKGLRKGEWVKYFEDGELSDRKNYGD